MILWVPILFSCQSFHILRDGTHLIWWCVFKLGLRLIPSIWFSFRVYALLVQFVSSWDYVLILRFFLILRLDWRLLWTWFILLITAPTLIIQTYSLKWLIRWWRHCDCIWTFYKNCIPISLLLWSRILRRLLLTFCRASLSGLRHSKTILSWMSMNRELLLVEQVFIHHEMLLVDS